MRKVTFNEYGYYHIFNRGVDKRKIYMDENDYQRFYLSLYAFNNANFVPSKGASLEEALSFQILERKPYVSILSFCLVPNHFHMLVRPLQGEWMSCFMQRTLTSYVKYFNLKHERTGRLFETEFKAVPAGEEGHFEHLPRYIHMNPLDAIDKNWRDGTVTDWDRDIAFLNGYRWSSHHVFLGKGQELPVVDDEFAKNMFRTPDAYVRYLKSWSTSQADLFKDLYRS